MNKRLLLGLLIIAPGLYASEDAQFEREREALLRLSGSSDSASSEEQAKERSAAVNADLAMITERDAVTPESEAIIARACKAPLAKAALLPTEIQEHIWSFADKEHRQKRFVGMNMEQLIPAVIEWVGTGTIFDCLRQMKAERVTLEGVNQYRAQLALQFNYPHPDIELPENKLHYMGSSYWEGEYRYRNGRNGIGGYYQAGGTGIEIRPPLATQRRPMPFSSVRNRLYALYYSNGATIFKVHDSKRAELEKLSAEQLEYTVNLYQTRARNLAERNSAEIHLTPEQVNLHKSLPTSMRVNLQNVYDLAEIKKEKAAAKRRKQCCTRLAYASLLALLGYEYLG